MSARRSPPGGGTISSGRNPDGYLGYAPDGRMYAIFIRHDRVTPADVVPTDEEGVQLLGSMVAYAGTYTLGEKQVIHHIDISWNQGWTGTDQVRFFELDGDTLTDHDRAVPKLSGRQGRTIDPGLGQGAGPVTPDCSRGNRMADIFGLSGRHALVTGASSGLGRHFAGVLAAAGAQVTVAARREAALAQTVESIRSSGAQAQSVRMDVTDASSVEQAFAEAETSSVRSPS